MCLHPSVSLNNEKICCEISEDKIAVCEKTAGLRCGKFSDLNSACSEVLVPIKIFQFQDMLNENRFLGTFGGHSKRPKKIPCKVTTAQFQFSLMRRFLLFFRQFQKLLATSNTCISVNIERKIKCYISKSKLIVCEYNGFYFSEIAFIGFTLHEIKEGIVFFGTPGICIYILINCIYIY